jgi:hypothetical protein
VDWELATAEIRLWRRPGHSSEDRRGRLCIGRPLCRGILLDPVDRLGEFRLSLGKRDFAPRRVGTFIAPGDRHLFSPATAINSLGARRPPAPKQRPTKRGGRRRPKMNWPSRWPILVGTAAISLRRPLQATHRVQDMTLIDCEGVAESLHLIPTTMCRLPCRSRPPGEDRALSKRSCSCCRRCTSQTCRSVPRSGSRCVTQPDALQIWRWRNLDDGPGARNARTSRPPRI